ncbi:hypothetical protein KI655_08255 [Vibrio sp. D404a]|uniref:hypothetical protein n=1 Tax=unclassified Vibrio TaxID=2614977 RepID=UPI0025530ADC|nr:MULTISPECIES: hypothetical protein [unclassified Vibrio]MDK9737290.1 hypothetical protein [Vibrio sp. D404a]MDK9798034.1 hypothetical protein [Vibrio sp. D449a]
MNSKAQVAFEKKRRKGRLLLIGLVIIFALPAIIAKTVLDQHWYNEGATNSGQLVEPRLMLSDLNIGFEDPNQGWLIGYIAPSDCDQLCEQQLHYIKQSHLALGKNRERVTPVVFSLSSQESRLLELPNFTQVDGNPALSARLGEASIVVIDPLGQLVMVYESVAQPEQLVSQSKGLIHDLRKLLKLSRVG